MKFKRSLALLVALAIFASLLLSACDKLKLKDVESDPVGQVEAAATASADALKARVSLLDPITAAKDKGVVTFSLDNADLGITLEGKSAYDTAQKRLSGAFSLESDGEKASFGIDVSDTKIALFSPELFDGVYGVDLRTLGDDLPESGIAKLLKIDFDEVLAEILPVTRIFSVEGEATINAACERIKTDLRATLEGAERTVEKTEFHHQNGAVSEVIEVSFDLAKKDVSDLLGLLKSDLKLFDSFASGPVGGDSTADLERAIDELRDEIAKDENDAKALLIFDLSRKTGELLSLGANVAVKSADFSGEFDLTVDLGAKGSASDQAYGTLSVTSTRGDDGEKSTDLVGMTFDLDRTDTEKVFGRKLSVVRTQTSGAETSVTSGVFDFKNDKETKTYVFTCDGEVDMNFVLPDEADFVPSGETVKFKETIAGKLDYTETTLTASVDTMDVEIEGKEPKKLENIGFTLSVSANDGDIPAMPEFTNAARLDFEGLMDLYIQLQNSTAKLPKLTAKFSALLDLLGNMRQDEDDGEDGEYVPDDMLALYDEFDERFDYNSDGALDEADREAWEQDWSPYGSQFDENYDYDFDGEVNTPADREEYDAARKAICAEDTGEVFNELYAEFNAEYDYDLDGEIGTELDRADYEAYYKPFADEFDPERDYDQDGIVDGDDREYYDYIRSH